MIQLHLPWVLLLLPLPWLIRRLFPRAEVTEKIALKVPFFHKITALPHNDAIHTSIRNTSTLLPYCIWTLLIIAAAGPQWLGAPIELPQAGRDIMLAVDISGSMEVPDMILDNKPAHRLSVVKNVAGNFIKKRTGDRVGLILFGSKAYLQTPLTFDKQTVLAMLEDATIGLAGPRTSIGDAIALSVKRLKERPKDSRVLILLTDGYSNSGALAPLAATQIAKSEAIKIYTIGLGADKLEVPGFFGTQIINPSRELDENTLKNIAHETGGKFFRAKDTQSLQQIYHLIDQLEPVKSDENLFRPTQPLFHWPLGLALILSAYIGLLRNRIEQPLIN